MAGKSTPETEELVKRRHAEGRSTYEIEEETGVSHQTIGKWLRKWGLAPHKNTRKRAKRAAAAAPQGPPQAAAPVVLPEPPGFPEPEDAPTGDLDPLDELKRIDRQIRAAMERAYQEMRSSTSALATYEKLASLRLKYASAIREMTPVEVANPEEDPTNIEAADKLHLNLARLVERAEKRAVCAHCGKAPFNQ